ncbi:MAG: tetratricopeptide repeat protein [Muribaculaceae bacterium]|nr:tetratricopeptide repeat protein [Muribaculaceae bacterium]
MHLSSGKILNRLYTLILVALVAGVGIVVSSCNARKKNTAAARQYTAFITRYNIHYNGDRHYSETLGEMEKNYEDDYTSLLLMHPAEARANEKLPQPSGDFNRSIEKAQKAIQLRSITKKPEKKRGKSNDPAYKAWMKRDEYNPFLHNDWMMMGRSQYMNGDFLGAASTFFYTSRRFNWLPATVVEARLWQARSYLAMDWLFEAETIITRIKPDELTNNENRRLYNMDFAEFYIKSGDREKAIPYLEQAIKLSSGAQKTRLNFLLGQLYSLSGNKQQAYAAFGKVASAPNATYRTKFNARIKQSEVFTGTNIESEIKALKGMTRLDRNKEYLDQIYYAIGNIYLSRGDTARAIENYREAAEKSTRGGIEKAISQITLGNLYYARRDYELAQPCYSEAVPQLPESYPDLVNLKRRSDVLDELALYSQNVHLQDSLLHLSEMPREYQMKVIDKIIEDLKKKEKEEAEAARREAFNAEREAQGSTLSNSSAAPSTFTMNTDGSWYFYNTPTRNAGKTEFQRRWGSRKLEDDWRRRNKTTFNTADFDSDSDDNPDKSDGESSSENDETPVDSEEARRAEDPHYAEFYLKQLPTTEAEKATARDVIQEGLYNMGVILKDRLDDYPAARAEFDRLLTEFPDNVYRLEVYYNLYLMAARSGDKTLENKYRDLILTDFPESSYGVAMADPAYLDNLKSMDSIQNGLYEHAYESYMNNDNAGVHAAYKEVSTKYPLSPLMPKFMFLEALAFVTEHKPDEFNTTLRELLERYPDTDVTPIASEWLKGMAKGRELKAGSSGSNLRGMLWDIALTNDSTATEGTPEIAFTLNDNDRQLLVFVFPTDRVDRNRLLYEIARHNFNSFVVKDFDLEVMNFGRLGMIVVKDFENLDELNHYRRVMAESPVFTLPAGVRPVVISAPNFDALLHSGGSLDSYFRFLEEQNYRDAQAGILPYHDIEELPDETDENAEGTETGSEDESNE